MAGPRQWSQVLGAGRTRLGCGLVSATPRACPFRLLAPRRRDGLVLRFGLYRLQRAARALPGWRGAAGPASVLAAHRGGPGGTCACVVGAPPAAATAVLSHLVSWPVRAAKPFRNPRPVMLAGAGQVCEGSGHGALLEVGRVIVHGGDRRAGEAAMALMRMATCTQLGVDGWCLATPVGVGGRASGRSRVRPREP